MTAVEVALSIILGLIVNEFSDVSPWAARRLVVWSARLRYGGTERAEIRGEELAAVINDRPGKLFKLCTALGFVSTALLIRLLRVVVRRAPAESAAETVLSALPRRVLPIEPEPSIRVARFLHPTEKYRGEWRRHWINLARGYAMIVLYAVFGIWAVQERFKPQYVARSTEAIVGAAVLLLGYRFLYWWTGRFVLTRNRLMFTEGVLYRRVGMIPLDNVSDLRYQQTPLGQLLNYGVFTLESARRGSTMRRLVDLPRPNELYLRIVEEIYEPEAVEARLGEIYADDRGYGDVSMLEFPDEPTIPPPPSESMDGD